MARLKAFHNNVWKITFTFCHPERSEDELLRACPKNLGYTHVLGHAMILWFSLHFIPFRMSYFNGIRKQRPWRNQTSRSFCFWCLPGVISVYILLSGKTTALKQGGGFIVTFKSNCCLLFTCLQLYYSPRQTQPMGPRFAGSSFV